MHNEIDFSKVERLAPRAESWDKVCACLDAMESTQPARKTNKLIRLPLYAALPIAASFILVGITVAVIALSHTESSLTESVDIEEMVSWFDGLGSGDSDYEELDEYGSISYLIK